MIREDDDIVNRDSYEILPSHPKTNSTFKKKLTIINKIKMLSLDSVNETKDLIKVENLKKFDIEVINALISSAVSYNNPKFTHKVTEIIYLFSFDNVFLSKMEKEILNLISTSDSIGTICCIYLEVKFIKMENKKEILDCLFKLIKYCIKVKKATLDILTILNYSISFNNNNGNFNEELFIDGNNGNTGNNRNNGNNRNTEICGNNKNCGNFNEELFIDGSKFILRKCYDRLTEEEYTPSDAEIFLFNELLRKLELISYLNESDLLSGEEGCDNKMGFSYIEKIKEEKLVEVSLDEFSEYDLPETEIIEEKILDVTSEINLEIQGFFEKSAASVDQFSNFISTYQNDIGILGAISKAKKFKISTLLACTRTVSLSKVVGCIISIYTKVAHKRIEPPSQLLKQHIMKPEIPIEVLCELVKFKIFKVNLIKEILIKDFRDLSFNKISRILVNIGRYLFAVDTTEKFISSYVKELLKYRFVNNEGIAIKNALSYLLGNQHKIVTEEEFLEYLIQFQKKNLVKENQSLILDSLLLHPKLFKSNAALANIIISYKKWYLVDFYMMKLLKSQMNLSTQSLYSFVEIICRVLRESENRCNFDFKEILNIFKADERFTISVQINLIIIYVDIFFYNKKGKFIIPKNSLSQNNGRIIFQEYLNFVATNLDKADDMTKSLCFTFYQRHCIKYDKSLFVSFMDKQHIEEDDESFDCDLFNRELDEMLK